MLSVRTATRDTSRASQPNKPTKPLKKREAALKREKAKYACHDSAVHSQGAIDVTTSDDNRNLSDVTGIDDLKPFPSMDGELVTLNYNDSEAFSASNTEVTEISNFLQDVVTPSFDDPVADTHLQPGCGVSGSAEPGCVSDDNDRNDCHTVGGECCRLQKKSNMYPI